MTLPLFAAAACGFLALGRVPPPAQSPAIILRARSDHALRVTLPPRSAIPRPWRRAAADPPDGKRGMVPTESALAVFLSYSTISAGWYLVGMAIVLAGPMSSIPIPRAASGVRLASGRSVWRLAAARLAGAWAMTFAASQVTTPWRGAGAVALTPAVRRVLGATRRALRVSGVVIPAALYMGSLALVFVSGLGLLGARELGALGGVSFSLGTTPLLSLAALAAFALRNSRAGAAISPPMLAFIFALGLGNAGMLPPAHESYDLCASVALPLSVALGLMSAAAPTAEAAEAGSVVGQSPANAPMRPMLLAFGAGTIGTILGALAAFKIVFSCGLLARPAAATATALMCATYVGGSANFFGVATATQAAARFPALVPSLLAADLALMGVYLIGLAAVAKSTWLTRAFPEPESRVESEPATPSLDVASSSPSLATVSPLQRVAAVSGTAVLAAILCVACLALERACGLPGSGVVALSCSSSVLGAALSRLRPVLAASAASPVRGLSLLLSCLFLASIGATARLAELIAAGPAAATVAATVLTIHCAVMLGVVALCNRSRRLPPVSAAQLVLASNANVGGAGTAVAMAGAMGWSKLVAPAAVCGAVGYSCATAIGVALHALLGAGSS